MLLTPMTLAELPRQLASFDAALAGFELAQRVLRKIAATLDYVCGEDIALSQDPAHHAQALQLLARFGLGALPIAPANAVTWDGSAVAVWMEPSVIIHEVAHYQLAPPERRQRVDFGLGAGPESGDKARGDGERTLFGVDCDREEALASLLGILWEAELGQPAILAFLEQNWLEGGASPANCAHFIRITGHLARHSFIDAEGRPTEKLLAHGEGFLEIEQPGEQRHQ